MENPEGTKNTTGNLTEVLLTGIVAFSLISWSPYLALWEKIALAFFALVVAIFHLRQGFFFALLIATLQVAVLEIGLAVLFFLVYAIALYVLQRRGEFKIFLLVALAPLFKCLGLGLMPLVVAGILGGPLAGFNAGFFSYLFIIGTGWIDSSILQNSLEPYQEALQLSIRAWDRHILLMGALQRYATPYLLLYIACWGGIGILAGVISSHCQDWKRYVFYALSYLGFFLLCFVGPLGHSQTILRALTCLYSWAAVSIWDWCLKNKPPFIKKMIGLHDEISAAMQNGVAQIKRFIIRSPRRQTPQVTIATRALIRFTLAYWLPMLVVLLLLDSHVQDMAETGKQMVRKVKYYDAVSDLIQWQKLLVSEAMLSGKLPEDLETWVQNAVPLGKAEQLLIDPWGNPYKFQKLSGPHDFDFRIDSAGPDGRWRTEDDMTTEYRGDM